MTKVVPLDREKQVPILKGILTTIKLLVQIDLLSEFVVSPEFQKEIGDPLDTIAKFRDPEGRVARFSRYLQNMSRGSSSNRRKKIKSPTFHQLIKQMEEASLWGQEDNRRLNEEWLSLKAHLGK